MQFISEKKTTKLLYLDFFIVHVIRRLLEQIYKIGMNQANLKGLIDYKK